MVCLASCKETDNTFVKADDDLTCIEKCDESKPYWYTRDGEKYCRNEDSCKPMEIVTEEKEC